MKKKKNNMKKEIPNPNNPRIIREEKFNKLKHSIKTLPGYMELRPIILDKDMMVLGGNMRLRASIALGKKEIWTDIFTEEMSEKMNIQAIKDGGEEKTYLEYCKEITIKDNTTSGDWEWDMLANEWDNVKLGEWGMDVWQPEESVSNETDYSINSLDEKLDRFLDAKIKNITIPFETEEFAVVVEKLEKLLDRYKCQDYRALIYKIIENEKV